MPLPNPISKPPVKVYRQIAIQVEGSSGLTALIQVGNQTFRPTVSTGSTISTIKRSVAETLGLTLEPVDEIEVEYDMSSTQRSSFKTTLHFTMNRGVPAKAELYVIDNQRDEMLFGADWLCSEGISISFGGDDAMRVVKVQNQ